MYNHADGGVQFRTSAHCSTNSDEGVQFETAEVFSESAIFTCCQITKLLFFGRDIHKFLKHIDQMILSSARFRSLIESYLYLSLREEYIFAVLG